MVLLKKQKRVRQFILSAAVLLGVMALLFALLRTIMAGYGAAWTGFGDYALPGGNYVRGKTLWDWMELLIIPLFLAVGAFILQRSESSVEREIAADRQQEAVLHAYLDRMGDLLLSEKLQEAASEKALNIMRVRTLTVLRGLNAARKNIVLGFLRDIEQGGKQEYKLSVAFDLEGADLKGVDLNNANFEHARLDGANLEGAFLFSANLQGAIMRNTILERAHLRDANLHRAVLSGANLQSAVLYNAILKNTNLKDARLQGANLQNADVEGANLEGANLEGANLKDTRLQGAFLGKANLRGARVSNEQLATVNSLKDAIMPDGTTHK